jgi:hypothetical protein
MKKNNHKYWLLFFSLIVLLSYSSCREEIISPKNTSGNLNEPYKSNSRNSYTFILNAENISQNVIDYPHISYSNSHIFISVLDYNSGSVEVIVLTKAKVILYRNKLVEDSKGVYSTLEGIKPEIIEIHFSNFTGKLKLQLTGVF